MITMMMLLCYVHLSGMSLEYIALMNNSLLGGQSCTDTVDIQRSGLIIGLDRLAIIPRLNFTCDGRITGIRARVFLSFDFRRNDYLSFQVWRPSSVGSTVYNKIGEVQLQSDDQVTGNNNDNRVANIILTGNNTIEFQSGDVVGYYHPPDARYQVLNTFRIGNGYVLYRFDGSPAPTSIDISERDVRLDFYQPLLQFSIGMD